MDRRLLDRLRSQMARGEVVLFTGAGFSIKACSRIGDTVPSSGGLLKALWPLAFPGQTIDENSSLADVFAVASQRAGNQVRDLLTNLLRIEPESLPDFYEQWFEMPWHRIYTLNVDDLAEAAGGRFSLPRRIRVVSALTSALPLDTVGNLLQVHLNGRISEYPEITFSERQYGERTARPDPWYQHLVSDLLTKPVLFIGTQLDEPPLWHHLGLRRGRNRGSRELRPGSYLVTPSLPTARAAVLESLNIDWVPMTQEEFALEVLSQLAEEKERGLRIVRSRSAPGDVNSSLKSVGELRTVPGSDLAEYLMGRQPRFADITSGYAVERSFETSLIERVSEENARVVSFTGTAGSGKSTTLMRAALAYHALGKDVRWLDLDGNLNPWDLPYAVGNSEIDVLVIDDVDSFGESTGEVISKVSASKDNLLVLAAATATRYERFHLQDEWNHLNHHEVRIPHLEDSDIDLLIGALASAGRLGTLQGKSTEEQRSAFREAAGRQLLVAMIEATSGQNFEEKIDRECSDLPPELSLIYAVTALATSLRQHVSKDEIFLATGEVNNERLNDLNRLISQHLLIEEHGGISVRHRVIADRAVDYYRRQGQLAEPVKGLLYAIASKVLPSGPRNRERRFLIRLMNHAYLRRLLPVGAVREAYDAIEPLLNWDYHFWLQRGSVEVELGDLSLAENFLNQARALESTDYKVQTAWAYMMLKKASQDVDAPDAEHRAAEAIRELEDAIAGRGASDSYPYHVLGSQGLSWVRRARLTLEEKKRILSKLRKLAGEGARAHPNQADLQQLSADLEREYLMLAVPPQSA